MIYPKDPSAWEMARGRIKEWRPIYMDRYTYPPEFKETKMTELKIKKERVLAAAEKCPDAKEVLTELFPDVFLSSGDVSEVAIMDVRVKVNAMGYTQLWLQSSGIDKDTDGIILTPKLYNSSNLRIKQKPDYASWFKLVKK